MLNFIHKKVRLSDELAPIALSQFHFEDDIKQKTFCGGALSLLLQLILIIIVLINGYALVYRTEPFTESTEADYRDSLNASDVQPVVFAFTNWKLEPLSIDPKYLKLNLKMYDMIQTGSEYKE
jgi:hypothetical protein